MLEPLPSRPGGDTDYRTVYLNQAARTTIGIDRAEVVDGGLYELVPPLPRLGGTAPGVLDRLAGIEEHPTMSRAEIAREYYEHARSEVSRCAPFEVQLDWLRATGFVNVDCYLKVLELALFAGQKPTAAQA